MVNRRIRSDITVCVCFVYSMTITIIVRHLVYKYEEELLLTIAFTEIKLTDFPGSHAINSRF